MHYSRVSVEVLDRTRVPLNASTHVLVVWSFSIKEFEIEGIKKEEKLTSKKLPRPDWSPRLTWSCGKKLRNHMWKWRWNSLRT